VFASVPPELELSLTVEFDELFALRDRIRQIADAVREQLTAAGVPNGFDADIFDDELELRGPEGSNFVIRLDSSNLEISGAPQELHIHLLAALILEEAGAFRLTSVESGFSLNLKVQRPLELVARAFTPIGMQGDEPMLDRRFTMTWEWGTATTGFFFLASDTEDQELFLNFKAREGYMTMDELKQGGWIQTQAARFDATMVRFLEQMGWKA